MSLASLGSLMFSELRDYLAGGRSVAGLGTIVTRDPATGRIALADMPDVASAWQDTVLPAAQVLALNATPRVVVTAPAANEIRIFDGALLFLDYGTAAYADLGATEDIEFRYTNGSGQLIATVETTGFLTATTDARRFVYAASTAAITPVAGAAIVMRIANGEVTTGDSPITVRTFFRTIPAL